MCWFSNMFVAVPLVLREIRDPASNRDNVIVGLSANSDSFIQLMNPAASLHTKKNIKLGFYQSLMKLAMLFWTI